MGIIKMASKKNFKKYALHRFADGGAINLDDVKEEYEERMSLDRDKFELEKGKDEERKKEFREKMDLELKKFDEKSNIDAARVGIAKEKLASVETGKRIIFNRNRCVLMVRWQII